VFITDTVHSGVILQRMVFRYLQATKFLQRRARSFLAYRKETMARVVKFFRLEERVFLENRVSDGGPSQHLRNMAEMATEMNSKRKKPKRKAGKAQKGGRKQLKHFDTMATMGSASPSPMGERRGGFNLFLTAESDVEGRLPEPFVASFCRSVVQIRVAFFWEQKQAWEESVVIWTRASRLARRHGRQLPELPLAPRPVREACLNDMDMLVIAAHNAYDAGLDVKNAKTVSRLLEVDGNVEAMSPVQERKVVRIGTQSSMNSPKRAER